MKLDSEVCAEDGEEEEEGSCLQDDGDLPTAPSEQPTSAQGAHKRQPRPQQEESRGAGRMGGGSHPDLDCASLYSSDTKRPSTKH